MIAAELLEKYGAVKKSFGKNDIIFEEGNLPLHYYQIISGEIKMTKPDAGASTQVYCSVALTKTD